MKTALFARIAGKAEKDPVAANGLAPVAALSMTRLADGPIDPKPVLTWILAAILAARGVPAGVVSALAPIRAAGALLPQVCLAGGLDRMRARRWMWWRARSGRVWPGRAGSGRVFRWRWR